jgi:PIN domain nuclease of toxin-antitoxin system
MNYISDAHALLWHLYWPQRLGKAAQQVFSDVDAGQAVIVIPAVVVAEVIMVVQKGRLSGASLDHLIPYLHSMNESENYPLAPLLPKTVIASHEHTIIPDIFDRLIVTEAILRDLSIITRDQTIRESGLVSTIWD